MTTSETLYWLEVYHAAIDAHLSIAKAEAIAYEAVKTLRIMGTARDD